MNAIQTILDATTLGPNELIDKEFVKRIKSDIPNLTSVLREAFKKLQQAKDMNIVVAIGNSAAGKSTMLTSLIYGADVLVLKKI